jgi:hypothetical protein
MHTLDRGSATRSALVTTDLITVTALRPFAEDREPRPNKVLADPVPIPDPNRLDKNRVPWKIGIAIFPQDEKR